MWTNEVVGFLPVGDERVELLDRAGQIGAGIELVAPGAVASLDAAVELGRAWWQHVEFDFPPLALGLELGHELRSAIDLDGLDGERHIGLELVEEQRCGRGGGAVAGFGHGPFRPGNSR